MTAAHQMLEACAVIAPLRCRGVGADGQTLSPVIAAGGDDGEQGGACAGRQPAAAGAAEGHPGGH